MLHIYSTLNLMNKDKIELLLIAINAFDACDIHFSSAWRCPPLPYNAHCKLRSHIEVIAEDEVICNIESPPNKVQHEVILQI